MVTRVNCGRKYKLVASTEKRVGIVLMAIRKLDLSLPKKQKRKRISQRKAELILIEKASNPLSIFEMNLQREIQSFKKQKQMIK